MSIYGTQLPQGIVEPLDSGQRAHRGLLAEFLSFRALSISLTMSPYYFLGESPCQALAGLDIQRQKRRRMRSDAANFARAVVGMIRSRYSLPHTIRMRKRVTASHNLRRRFRTDG
jgi:hypothetical protein